MADPVLTGVEVDFTAVGAGDTTVYAAQPGKYFKVFRIVLTMISDNDFTLRFKSGSTNLPGPLQFKAGWASITLGMELRRWVQTAVNEPLVINLSAATSVKGALTVQVLDA